jgi:arsenate reductase-like glutaredoxin family protein
MTMTRKITVYQKPAGSKCRTTLCLLKERGVAFVAINYSVKCGFVLAGKAC